MNALFEISGFNIYIQIAMTVFMISVHLFRTRKNRRESVTEIFAIYVIGLTGWFTISNAIFGHLIYADEVATSIGWPLNSGFQSELAFSLIGIGILGGVGMWIRSFWLPFIIAKSTMMWGAALTHMIHRIEHNNFSPSNTGIVVYWDVLLPIVLIVVYVYYMREQNEKLGSS